MNMDLLKELIKLYQAHTIDMAELIKQIHEVHLSLNANATLEETQDLVEEVVYNRPSHRKIAERRKRIINNLLNS